MHVLGSLSYNLSIARKNKTVYPCSFTPWSSEVGSSTSEQQPIQLPACKSTEMVQGQNGHVCTNLCVSQESMLSKGLIVQMRRPAFAKMPQSRRSCSTKESKQCEAARIPD